ncbi:hypothetical protein VCHA43P277_130082 [Vibrio chagasii]|nr:hypothetical protein VCHA34P126_120082 [Vibrio chagasii]CAH6818759.1 hypothetical protein VCHA36P161_130087 [Vibrio chagasii]CAH6937790.1 hypothetical protein VCHA43P277_130082 [Vibrio chagasii]CAH6968983.1 hypothetical protein VCHA41O247_120084 [Vibrio chagasii]CAH7212853.1 hypothetical protein VCHA50P420_140087 [Vibrio chagasii]
MKIGYSCSINEKRKEQLPPPSDLTPKEQYNHKRKHSVKMHGIHRAIGNQQTQLTNK